MATNLSNIVKKKELRKAQLDTLEKIASVVGETAGPCGSYTMILNDGMSNVFTKDGHKVLSNIKFFHPLEKSIIEEIESSTGYIVRIVGDGTTAMTKLAYEVFKRLCMYEESHPDVPRHKIINALKKAIVTLQDYIMASKRDMTLGDVYKICMVSTDGNKEVSETIANIYGEYGADVFIELGISNTEDHIIRSFDGMTVQRGYPSPAYINNDKGTCEIDHPRLYCFTDPVDTPDMINLFSRIVYENITVPIQKNNRNPQFIPTVIMCPSITRDFGDTLAQIESMMYSYERNEYKPPLLIITNFTLDLQFYQDLIMLTGAPNIKKYISEEIHKEEVKKGNAPSVDNVTEFYGTCDRIICDNNSTCFINPEKMYTENKDGKREYSTEYLSLIKFVKEELQHSIDNSDDISIINNTKRRLHSLESNYVEYLIGGISSGDRNNVKDLAEDAILNCRSAALKGVGRGANFEGLVNSTELLNNLLRMKEDDESNNIDQLDIDMARLLNSSFDDLVLSLYESVFGNKEDAQKELINSIINDQPINLRTMEYNKDVLCSIETDYAILEAISRIETMMFNTTQSLLFTPTENIYISDEDLRKD